MKLKQYFLIEQKQQEEIEFLNILKKLYKEAVKKELDKWGDESAKQLAGYGINAEEVFNKMKINKDNVKFRILNNLEKQNLIKTIRKAFSSEKVKKYNYGRDRKYTTQQSVSVSVKPS
jgi:hypothetical protein